MYRRTHNSLYKHGRYKRQARGADLFMFSVACVAIAALVVTATGYTSSGTSAKIAAGNSTTSNSTLSRVSVSNSAANTTNISVAAPLHSLNARCVVCIGDSVTEGFADPNNWPSDLKERLGGDWEVINQGAGGAKTADMLNRIDAVLALNPRFVIVMGGINDLAKGESLSAIERNIYAMCTRVESYGAVPVLCTVTPTGDYLEQKEDLNTWITEHARMKGYDLIDFYAVLNNKSKPGYPDPALVYDGTHPNKEGYIAMSNAIDLAIFTEAGYNTTQQPTAAVK